jgi:hypothetical protein
VLEVLEERARTAAYFEDAGAGTVRAIGIDTIDAVALQQVLNELAAANLPPPLVMIQDFVNELFHYALSAGVSRLDVDIDAKFREK